ncbi:glycine betaine/L-proline transporter ProP [Pseudonocardia ailaonensis]|uniref:Glycine betaine/L-proline transporter ProP n=1 Tax=Pseudonocardia ailaonensis TaxID=367279 RepID=A0ABN2N199_9PSEU
MSRPTHDLTVPSGDDLPEGATPGNEAGPSRRRVVLSASAGTFVEYYDFAIYGAFATTLAQVFFPQQDPTAALLSTFAVFAGAFVARPLGGLIWGPLGDRIGRQRTLVITITVMTIATIVIGLIPSHASIGALAPVLLVVMRLVQGLSAGGEMPGAAIFVGEHSPARRRGYLASWLQVSNVVALLTGILIAAILTGLLSPEDLQSWGWRIPFFIAAPLGLIGLYVRRRVEDTPSFTALKEAGGTARSPIRDLFAGGHLKPFLLAMALATPTTVPYYLLMTYMPTFFRTGLKFSQAQGLWAVVAAGAVLLAVIPFAGRLSDRIGRRRALMTACLAFFVLTFPAWALLTSGHFALAVLGMMVLSVPCGLAMGNLLAAAIEQFPTAVRYTGFALSLGVSVALFSGTAPYVSAALVSGTGSLYAPAFYLVGVVLLPFLASFALRDTSRRPLAD